MTTYTPPKYVSALRRTDVAATLTEHAPDPRWACRCGTPTSDPPTWAAHVAAVLHP